MTRSNATPVSVVDAADASESCPCAGCGAAVDPLRAAAVRIFDERYRFYCSRECLERDAPTARAPHAVRPGPAAPPSLLEVVDMLGIPRASLPPAVLDGLDGPAPDADDPASRGRLAAEPADPVAPAVAVLSAAFGAVVASLDVLSPSARVALTALASMAALAVAARELWSSRADAGVGGWVVGLVGAALPTAFALGGALPALADALRDTALLAALGPVVTWAARTRRVAARSRLDEFRRELPAEATIPGDSGDEVVEASRLHAGAVVIVRAGDTVPVDGTVRDGEAELRPWPSAPRTQRRGAGDAVLAGAKVLGGSVRIVATRAGDEVAWSRLTRLMNDSVEGPRTVRLARRLASLAPAGVLAAAAATAVLRLFFAAGDVPRAVACVLALAPCALAASVVEVPFIDALVRAARRGIVFRDAASVEAVGAVGTVALCLRGTVTVGRMELTDVVSMGARSERALLALAAGCEEAAVGDPIAAGIRAAAEARRVRPESVRRPVAVPGHGVLAVSAAGEPIVVGSARALLAEGVSVAQGEDVIAAIEGAGRTALLIACDGRLEGILGLQDPVREEARSAVQSIIDAGFDVALIGGASRATTEAIAATLDVSNLRPEVLPEERAAVVRGMSEIGNGVVVVGRPGRDGATLAAADAAISLEAAGGSGGETAVALASDDLRDAATALVLARGARDRALKALALGAAGTGFGAFAVAAVPSAGLIGVIAAAAVIVAGQAALLRERDLEA